MHTAAAVLAFCLLALSLPAQAPDPTLHADLGRSSTRLQQGDAAGAAAILERVLARHPTLATVWLRLSLCQLAQDKAAEAGAAAEKALGLDPALDEAAVLAAECWVKVDGRKGAQLALAASARSLEADHRRRLLQVLVSGKELDAAQKLLGELLVDLPQDVALRTLATRIALDLGQPERALAAVSIAVKLAPGDPNLADSRCQICFALGRTADGILAAERALELNPANLPVRERLIAALLRIGAPAERIALQRRYLEHYQKADQRAAGAPAR